MIAIYERELDSQLNGLTGYVYGALVLLFGGIYVMAYHLEGAVDFTYVLYSPYSSSSQLSVNRSTIVFVSFT